MHQKAPCCVAILHTSFTCMIHNEWHVIAKRVGLQVDSCTVQGQTQPALHKLLQSKLLATQHGKTAMCCHCSVNNGATQQPGPVPALRVKERKWYVRQKLLQKHRNATVTYNRSSGTVLWQQWFQKSGKYYVSTAQTRRGSTTTRTEE